MSAGDDKPTRSGFRAFWSTLPGVLTGIAALVTAVVSPAALFTNGDETDASARGEVVGEPAAATPGTAGEDCFARYLAGIPAGRIGTVEAGGYDDVLTETEPKAGPLGMTLTDFGRPVAAIRFAFFPENVLFKIESVVDGNCRRIESYENRIGGDKRVWKDSTSVRIQLGERYYDLTANGSGSIVRVAFAAVAP